MRDAIVIGGGIAGMSAAWRLRHSDVLVLEGSNRIGGRLRSERRGATGSTGAGTSSEEKVLSPTNC